VAKAEVLKAEMLKPKRCKPKMLKPEMFKPEMLKTESRKAEERDPQSVAFNGRASVADFALVWALPPFASLLRRVPELAKGRWSCSCVSFMTGSSGKGGKRCDEGAVGSAKG
jgi:hypothetical protein